MEIISVDDKGLFIINANDVYVKRVENKLFIFDVGASSSYAKLLIDVTLASTTGQYLEDRLSALTKTKLFDMTIVTNYPVSRSSTLGNTVLVDSYVRYSKIGIDHVVDGYYTNKTTGRTSTVKNEHVKAILEKVDSLTPEKMELLKELNIIRTYEYVEYPWVDNFTFVQPKNSPKPEDYKVTL